MGALKSRVWRITIVKRPHDAKTIHLLSSLPLPLDIWGGGSGGNSSSWLTAALFVNTPPPLCFSMLVSEQGAI